MERKAACEWHEIAEVKLVYKPKVKAAHRPTIINSESCYQLLMTVWNAETMELREEFKMVFLNRVHKVLGVYHASSGGVSGTIADPKLIFAVTLKAAACALIVAHNHPSGNLRPSKANEQLTQKIKAAAMLLGMKLLDHLIVHSDGYYSFADEGLVRDKSHHVFPREPICYEAGARGFPNGDS